MNCLSELLNRVLPVCARRLLTGTVLVGLLVAAACGPITISEPTATSVPPTAAPPTGTPTFTPIPTFAPPTDTPTPTSTPTPDPTEESAGPTVGDAETAETNISNRETIPWLVDDLLKDYSLPGPGEPIEFEVALDTDAITWDTWWCAATQVFLTGNIAVMEFSYALNDEPLDPTTQAFIFPQHFPDGSVCQVTAFYLEDWPTGEHTLTSTFTLTGNINDGFAVYRPGDYETIYRITVP